MFNYNLVSVVSDFNIVSVFSDYLFLLQSSTCSQ